MYEFILYFTITLEHNSWDKKVACIKQLRSIFEGMGLKTAKDMMESAFDFPSETPNSEHDEITGMYAPRIFTMKTRNVDDYTNAVRSIAKQSGEAIVVTINNTDVMVSNQATEYFNSRGDKL